MADTNLREFALPGMQPPTRLPDGPSAFRHDAYGKLDDPLTPRSYVDPHTPRGGTAHNRVEGASTARTGAGHNKVESISSVSQGLQMALHKVKERELASKEQSPKAAYTPQWEKEPQIATVSEGLNLALSRLERRASDDVPPTKLTERKEPTGSGLSPPTSVVQPKRTLSSMRVGNASSANLNRKKELPGKAAARFQKLVFMVAHEMGHTLRMERIFHGSDQLESRCLVVQLGLIFVASVLATATSEHGWNGEHFVSDDTTLALQIATSFLTVLSLCVWYREHRIILHLTSVKIHGWFSFPSPLTSLLQFTLLVVHGPPGTNPIFAILTFFRCIFIFRIFKFHPAVQGIRDSQLAAGSIPSFSPLFYFKTVIRVKPLLAMASILVIVLTPVTIAYTFTERYADDPLLDTTFVGVAWTMIYFAVTQQPPVPSIPSRTLCILASFVASALFTFIFTGMLSALELDAGHSAALKKAFERNLRKSHRDAAATMIQSHYRAAKQKNPKTEVAASVARQKFKTLSRDLQLYLAEKEGGLNLTSLIYDVNDNCLENISLVKSLTGMLEQRADELTKLETENRTELVSRLQAHTESIRGITEGHTNSIVETENKALSSITSHFEATQALILESAGQITAAGARNGSGERIPVQSSNPQIEKLFELIKAQGEAMAVLRRENTELHLANQQGMGKIISTQDQRHASSQQTFSQQAELLLKLQSRQESQEKALVSLQAREEEHFNAIMQALTNLASSQAAAAMSGGSSMSPESLQKLLASQAPASPNPQVLQKLQASQDEQAAQKQMLIALTTTQERALALLENQQQELKAHQDSTSAVLKTHSDHTASLLKTNQDQITNLDVRVQALQKGQTEQGVAIDKLHTSQEASQASNLALVNNLQAEVRGHGEQVYSEVQSVLAILAASQTQPTPAPPPPIVEEKEEPKPEVKPAVDQYADVYIPEEQRQYPQYVYDVAKEVEAKKVKAIFSAFALYDLFPIIDRDRSGMLSSNEVRRITFDSDIHGAYKKKERKPWPTEQMNKLQAEITKLFKGRKIQMDQKAFVTSLAAVPMSQ